MATNMMTVTGIIILEPLHEEAEGKTDAILRFRPVPEAEAEENSQGEFSGPGSEGMADDKKSGEEFFENRPLEEGEIEKDSRSEFFESGTSAGRTAEKNSDEEFFESGTSEDGKNESDSEDTYLEFDLIPEEDDEPTADDRNYQVFRRRQAAATASAKNVPEDGKGE